MARLRDRTGARGIALLAAAALLGGAAGCAATGVSFETLGVPAVTVSQGRAAVVLGWEREAREGWVLSAVRVEGRARSEWDAASQRPAVLVLEPGLHPIQLVAEQRPAGGHGGSRRLRLAPVEVRLREAEALVCRVRLVGRDGGRRRPRLRCDQAGRGDDEPADLQAELIESPYRLWTEAPEPPRTAEAAPSDAARVEPAIAGPASAPVGELLHSPYAQAPDDLVDRMRLLEARLDRMERVVRELARDRRPPDSTPAPEP